MSEYLKPCPFCGEADLLTAWRWVDEDTPEIWNHKKEAVRCINPECSVQPSLWGRSNWNRLYVEGWVD